MFLSIVILIVMKLFLNKIFAKKNLAISYFVNSQKPLYIFVRFSKDTDPFNLQQNVSRYTLYCSFEIKCP